MSSREVDYEKQFKDDLEKATALSLETLALEEFRRSKLGYISPAETQKFTLNYRSQIQSATTTNYQPQTAATSPPRPENDLISFSSPTVKQPKSEDENPTLKFLKDLNQQYNSQPATPQGMQLVPYFPSAQQTPPNNQIQLHQQQQQRLTNEELQKLYSMPPPQTMPQYTPNVFPAPFRQTVPSVVPTTVPVPASYSGYYGFVVPQPQQQLYTSHHPMQPQLHQQPQQPQTMFPQPAFQPLSSEKALVLRTSSPVPATGPAQSLQQSIPGTSIQRSNSGSSISLAASMPSSAAAQVNAEIKRKLSKKQSSIVKDDLIDLGVDDSKVSVLEAFDPLLSRDEEYGNDDASDCTSNYYPEYDPFDYLYSEGTQYSDPVYEAVNKKDRTPISPSNSVIGWRPELYPSKDKDYDTLRSSKSLSITASPPPLPPRNNSIPSSSTGQQTSQEILDRRKNMPKLYEVITDRKSLEPELMEFYYMVKELRNNYRFDDESTNIGHVVASEFNYLYPEGTEIKILVHPVLDILQKDCEASQGGQVPGYGAPIAFTCVVESIVEMVVGQAVCSLEGQIVGSVDQYAAKPIGLMEWLSPTTKLSQLEYVHNCMKLGNDINLGLCLKTEANMKTIARTERDDRRDIDLKPEDILPSQTAATINYSSLMILIETLEEEMRKLEVSVAENSSHISCTSVEETVKYICALFGEIDTLEINEVLQDLRKTCSSGQSMYSPYSNPNIVSENGDYAEVSLRPKSLVDQIKLKCNQLREVTQELIEIYSNAFRVNFYVKTVDYITTPISVSNVLKTVMVHISCLHRPAKNWKYDDYILAAQLYHGTRYMHREPLITQCSNDMSGGMFQRLKFDTWIEFPKNPICTLPRESRMIFVLYGTEPMDNEQSSNNENNGEKKQVRTELGWCAIQLFDFQREMINGSYLLSMWPPTTDKFLGPAPSKGSHPHSDTCSVLSIEIPSYGGRIVFPEPIENPPPAPRYDFSSLDNNLQQELLDTADQGYPGGALDKREVFWEKRHYLQNFPHALPKVLHAAHSWDYASLIDLHSLLKSWKPLAPLQALELLLPRYPDAAVRAKAVEWISQMPNEVLVDYLPQFLQALKHDTYEASPMAKLLLSRCLECPRIAHHMYWLLMHSLPGDSPQNTQFYEKNEPLITQARYHRRNKMMLRALLACCGERFASKLISQEMMCLKLAQVAKSVKESKDSVRLKEMQKGLEGIQQTLMDNPTILPLGPGLEVSGISIRNSNYFNSNTLPIKIAFVGPDKTLLPAIFKAGDDLQQDMLTIQLVRVMNKLWLAEKLDLKIVTFDCVPTGYRKGMIEMVSEAETLRKIQVEYGLTGSFKDRPIAEWLAKQNPSQLEYDRAVNNFTASCAGYSVATYILGICDRHNDNIMLKTSGHLFHIDFGKFLGDAQMFGNFKRDRAPFVLTSDMAYVINGGDKPSIKFHAFVDTCCRAFNIVRKHGDLILQMLALMASAGIPGVTANAVQYVRNALLPTQSNPEAAASFAKMIQSSLKSWFTQVNFFLHNLASMRFSNDEGSGELLSFVPRKYTMQQDGKLKSVTVHSFQKRYDMEKYYTYILKVGRHGNTDPSYLFRSYKEFTEFHQKLCLHFPLVKLHSLPSGIHVGRSNIKSVAERRQPEIKKFLESLFNSPPEIAHSDLVYTFFHPLYRDQQEANNIHLLKVKEKALKPADNYFNQESYIKISLQYRRETLTVMIHHAKGLPLTNGGQEPNTYVKCYLKPDPSKGTKRKTKVVRKTCVPSFMETLEYRMPLELIQIKSLNVTIWSHDSLQENELLGGFTLDLSKLNLTEEIIDWYRLEYQPRNS